MSRALFVTVATMVAVAPAAPTFAQQSHAGRFERQLREIERDTRLRINPDIPVDQRALLEYGGFFTFNFLAIDDTNQETHILRQYDLNGYIRLNIDNVHQFFVRARTSYRDFNSGDAFDSHDDDSIEPTFDRAHYRFDLARAVAGSEGRRIKGNVTFQGGRQLVHWANGLALSQVLDGAVVGLSYHPFYVELLAGRTRESTIDIDSSRPGFNGDTKRAFYGAKIEVQAGAMHRPYVFGLIQNDSNDNEVATNIIADSTIATRFEYESYYIGFGSSGNITDRMLYAAEIVFQGGDGLSNSFDSATGAQITQTREDIEAFALDVRVNWLMTDLNNTRFTFEILVASGDTDRLTTTNTLGGNQPGTDDHAFNGFGLINAGLAFAPNVSNLVMARGGASMFPWPGNGMFRKLQVGANLFLFNKFNRHAPIDELTTNDTYLGFETDFFVNWQVTSDLSVAMRYGIFFPGDAISVDHDERHFVYTGVTLAF